MRCLPPLPFTGASSSRPPPPPTGNRPARSRRLRRLVVSVAIACWTFDGVSQSATNCSVTLLNRSVQLGPAGSFGIPNLPFQQGYFRVRIACTEDGQASGGQSAFFRLTPNGTVQVPPIALGPLSPLPVGLTIASPKTNLATKGETAQFTAQASYADGSSNDVTSPALGTWWSSSNPNIVEVNSNGVATAVARGGALIQAFNEGVQATFPIEVTISGDADNDGLPDDYEIAFRLQPNDPSDGALDFDADGLSNLEEFQNGTNPRVGDTDDDGVLDGEEARLGTSPTRADTDRDGLADGQELRRGLNPVLNDTDRDGIQDGLELALGLNPLVPDATTRAQGRVLDTNGAPVAGASVVIFEEMTARTDESGAFSLPNVPATLGPIQAVAETVRAGRVYDVTSAAIPAVPGGVTDLRNLLLRLNSGNVAGTVTDPLNAVVAGALVTVSNGRDTRTARTDASGFYRIPNMTAGNLRVTVRDPKTGLRGPAQGTLALNQSAVVNVRLGPFGTVVGTAYARDGVTPLGAGVPVTISGSLALTVLTDVLGKYRFEFVPLGTYAVEAADGSGNRGRNSGEILATSQVRVSDISFLGRGTIAGLVLNGAQPVANAAVTFSSQGVFGGSGGTTSGPSGQFSFSNMFAGPFIITAQIVATRLAGSITGAVQFDGQFLSNNVALASSGTITGTVFRAGGTTAVANAEVALLRAAPGLSPTGLRTTTDESGKFGFSLVPLGNYLVDAVDPGTGDSGRGGGGSLSFQNQVLVGNVNLAGLSSVTVLVRDGGGMPVEAAQVTLFVSTPVSASYSAVSDAAGRANFGLLPAGPMTVTARDRDTGLFGTTNALAGIGVQTNVIVQLQAAGTIAGRVLLPGGTAPAQGMTVRLFGSGLGFSGTTRQQTTGADGAFRFDKCALASYTLLANDSLGRNRARADLVISNHAQTITRDLTMNGAGTVTGIVRFTDGTPFPSHAVYLTSQPGTPSSESLGSVTDVDGRYTIPGVAVGPFTVNVQIRINSIDYSGTASGQIQTNGETVTADVQLNGDLVLSIASLFDGNNSPYDLQSHGGLRSGAGNVFGFPQVDRGAARLELLAGGSTNPFVGRLPAVSLLNGREISITQTGLVAGLDVTRRIFIPRDGYFARYLEVLSNRSPGAITVDVRLTSSFRYTFTPVLAEPRILATSSGDTILLATNTPARDRWVVIDDNSDADPFLSNTLPSVAHVFDGTNGQRQAASAAFTLDPADNAGFGRLVQRWTNIVVPAGTNVKILHFVVQQMNAAAAQAAAVRLSQIPPEALTGLSASDLRTVQNFALPTNGISAVPSLVGLTGTINGLVLSGDAATPVARARVSYRSTNLLFGRTYTSLADDLGRMQFASYLSGAAGAVPLNGFTLVATQSQLGIASPMVTGTFGPGSPVATQNVVFTGAGVLTGTVRRHSNVVASAGAVRVTGEPLPGPLALGIAPNGAYGVSALVPNVYSLFAEVPTAQGSPLTGAASAPIAAGQTTVADIVIQETGTLMGTLRRTNGSVAVNLRVQLRGAGNLARSVFTDTGGRFTFGDAPSGLVSLEAFEPANNIAARAEVTVLTDQTVVQDLFLSADGTVTGAVLASTGEPMAGAQVRLQVGSAVFSGTAASNGTYRFTAVPLGNVVVAARDAGTGFRGFSNGLLAVSGHTLSLDIRAAAVGSVMGTVFAPDGTSVVPGATVTALGGALSTVADAAGNYLLDFAPVGGVTVSALHPSSGEAGAAAALVSSNDAVVTANIVLAPIVTILGTTLGEGSAGTRDAIFTLNLSMPSSRPAFARYFTSPGTAVALSDYLPTNGVVTFPPGVTNRTLTVKILGDTALEPDETFSLVLADATNLTLVVPRASGTITNDDRLPGHVDHFEWAPIPGPQLDHVPFAVTVTARDFANAVVTNFTGPARLSATAGGGPFSGTLLGLPPHNLRQTKASVMEVGNQFIPTNDILVTHVLSYFGTKVTISKDGGEILVAPAVSSTPGTWIETPLQQPLRLAAGQVYLVSVLVPGGRDAFRRLGLVTSFPHGALLAPAAGGTVQNPDAFGWWMVDLRYSPITSTAVATVPADTGSFSNGVWTGDVSILAPATNAVLSADDGDGHAGLANGIDVRYGNDVLISVQASPEPVPLGGTLFYTIAVTNTGPAVATDVVVTNMLPNGFRFLSANGTLGSCSLANGTVTCTMPEVPRGAIALVGIAVQPQSVATVFDTSVNQFRERPVTNVVGVTRAGPDGHLLNNSAQAVTRVLRPTLSVSDPAVREGNGEFRTAAFELSLSYPTPEQVLVVCQTFNQFGPGGTATPDVDYVRTSGNVIFAPFETNKTVHVTLLGDSTVEPPETFFLYVFPQSTATATRSNGVATILNDDGRPDQVHHFDWAAISSPQFVNEPLAVTLTAKNDAGGTVSNFNGQVVLSGAVPTPGLTNLLLVKNDPHASSTDLSLDRSLGYVFTPSTNIVVTHVRRYFGERVSIWSDGGTLLSRQSVPGASATWIEAPLPDPLLLLAGVRYRISTYAPAGTHYSRPLGADQFPHGSIVTGCFGEGDAFPADSDGPPRWMVGLKYFTGKPVAVPVSPANATGFGDGVWTGFVTVGMPATNITLRADDGDGDIGVGGPFTVQLRNDLAVLAAAVPAPADIRSNLIYTITVTNTGPAAATGVTVTNTLPAEVNLVSVAISQGASSVGGRTIGGSFGTLAAAGSATLTITCRPALDGIVLTNVAVTGRAEADALGSNNAVAIETGVRTFSGAAVAILGSQANAAWQADVRAKIESSGYFGTVVFRPVQGGTSVPSGSELEGYGAVLVYRSNPFNDATALGDVLADYIDAGFGVVAAPDAFHRDNGLKGRLISQNYLPFTQGDFASGANLSLIADDALHPLLDGVLSFQGGSSSSHQTVGLTPGATQVAHWSNGRPLVGAKASAAGRTVGLNFFPQSSDVSASFWDARSDGARLMANALRWAMAAPPPLPDDLALSLIQVPAGPRVGGTLTYTLVLTNPGPSFATGVVLTNTLPAGFEVLALTASQGTVTNLGALVMSSLGTVPAGAAATVTIAVRAPQPGRFTNVASVLRAEADAYLRNNRASSVAIVTSPVITVSNALAVTEGNVGTTNAVFPVALSFPSPYVVSVSFQIQENTAGAASDYVATNGTLAFAPGETNQFLPVTVLADNISEGTESFSLQLLDVTNATLANASAVGTILDDDPPPVVAVADAVAFEGDGGTPTLTFNLSLSPSSGALVSLLCTLSNGTATANSDFMPDAFAVSFPPGATNQTVVARLIGDVAPEPDETFTVHLANVSGATPGRSVATGTILNDDGVAGRLDHFDWSVIPSPQVLNTPFPVNITARDALGNVVSTFDGPLPINDGYPLAKTNTVFKNQAGSPFGVTSAELTLGYAIIPVADLIVTHVLRYFGDKVSIWTDNGERIVEQPLTGPPGQWREVALPAPVTLRRGTRYRITVHNPPSQSYYAAPLPEPVPEIGNALAGGCSTIGDAFPSGNFIGLSSYLVDIRYVVPLSPRFAPAGTGLFTNGVWAGQLTALATTNNVRLGVDDSLGHSGRANPIAIVARHDLTVGAGPNPVAAGATLHVFLNILNQSTAPATGVTITNLLPAGVDLLSVTQSQGSVSVAGSLVTCNIGTLAGNTGFLPGSMASVALRVRPTAEGTLTNFAWAGRNEATPDAGQVVTTLIHVGTNSPVVGFFTDGNETTTAPASLIQRVGLVSIHISDIASFDLKSIGILMLNNFQFPISGALQQRLPAIESWVRAGGVMVIHNVYGGNVPYLGPLLPGVTAIPAGNSPFVSITPPGDTLVTTGPFGTLVSFDTSGQLSVTIPAYTDAVRRDSLPAGARSILFRGIDLEAAFSYPFGRGHIYYSVIPLDYYLEAPNQAPTNIYAPNVLVYAQSLASMPNAVEPSRPEFVLGPGSTGWTPSGGFRFQIDGLSGHGMVIISASSNLLDWEAVFTNPPVTGTIQFIDAGASNKPFRFYRVEER